MKGNVSALIGLLSTYSPRGNEVKFGNSQSRQPVARPRLESLTTEALQPTSSLINGSI
jgi:hypothetical protein